MCELYRHYQIKFKLLRMILTQERTSYKTCLNIECILKIADTEARKTAQSVNGIKSDTQHLTYN